MRFERRWLWQAIFWGGYAAVSLAVVGQFAPLTSGIFLIMALVASGLFAASEALRAAALARGWLDLPGWSLAWRVVVLVPLAAALIQGVVFLAVRAGLSLGWIALPATSGPYRLGTAAGYVVNTAIMLWLWTGGWLTAVYIDRFRQGEIAKARAEAAQHKLELDVLKGQINPHFIFNALNNLRAMINEDKDKAREMVTQLANIHRHTLYHSERDRVTVAEELSVVRDYVALEQLHYEGCMTVDWRIGANVDDATLPPMLLQLLVENAVKHGIGKTVGGGLISIAVDREAQRLRVSVANPGRWEPGPDRGIGLKNLNERLVRASGEGAACNIESENGTVRVTVDIPQ
jgi:two-component sensor histidine kinase